MLTTESAEARLSGGHPCHGEGPSAPRRQGRPCLLVLNKTEALFAREQKARIRDETDLDWLTAEWNLSA